MYNSEFWRLFQNPLDERATRLLGGAAVTAMLAVGAGWLLTSDSDASQNIKNTVAEQTVGRIIPNLPRSSEPIAIIPKVEIPQKVQIPEANANYDQADYIVPAALLLGSAALVTYVAVGVSRKRNQIGAPVYQPPREKYELSNEDVGAFNQLVSSYNRID